MKKQMMKGCEAIAEAAIQAGCKLFFGYPITPQNEIPEYMAKHLPKMGGQFVQAESEIAASNMIYGAAAAGFRAMTSSSSPGITLKQEGLSYCAGAELPVVVVNIMRGGPGLGGIHPSQSDYWQATRPGHGDFHYLVLAPATIQEAADLVMEAFDLADKYRNPVMILGDGLIGQMMEPVSFKTYTTKNFDKTWATTGCMNRPPNIINSLYLDPLLLEAHNFKLGNKYKQMKEEEIRVEIYHMEDAQVCFTAYGTVARICKTAVAALRKEGIPAGLIRPISLFPFPTHALKTASENAKFILDVEMSMGQMLDDVKLSIESKIPVYFYNRVGGIVPTPEEIVEYAKKCLGELGS